MTDIARDGCNSNVAAPRAMAVLNDVDSGKDATAANAPQSSSPSKEKRSAAPESEAPTKTSKKRRKVNHGKALMLCTWHTLDNLLTTYHF
jgi:hypothetical protein